MLEDRKFFSIIVFLLILTVSVTFSFSKDKLIEILVEVTEVDDTRSADFGINWGETLMIAATQDNVAVENVLYGNIRFLMSKGVADLIASPKLVTKNGSTATLNVGGEIPYVTITNNSPHIEFKKYGVIMEIKPTVETGNIINLKINTQVSAPDAATSVALGNGIVVPGILMRSVESELNVESGKMITIAGLKQTRKEKIKTGIPLLCDIPLMGALFSWNKTIDKKTSVVIFLTPYLVSD